MADNTPECGDFKRGKCFRATCKYSHVQADGTPASLPSPAGVECGDFKRGYCRRGGACRYTHVSAPLPLGSQYAPLGMPSPYAAPSGMAAFNGLAPSGMAGLNSLSATAAAPGAEECGDYKNGRCTRGGSCKYVHTVSPYAPSGMAAFNGLAPSGMAGLNSLSATAAAPGAEECGDYKNGRCTRGGSCKYVHTVSPYAPSGMAAFNGLAPSGIAAFSSLSATAAAPGAEECGDYKNGRCNRGGSCKYVHTVRPAMLAQWLGSAHGANPFGSPYDHRAVGRFQEELCRDFEKGLCERDSCKFSHGETCADNAMGRCTRGDSCKYSHHNTKKRGREQEECGDFKRGVCSREKCKYAHVAPPAKKQASAENKQTPEVEQASAEDSPAV
eukprot:CAMPEP_0205833736 /NCGR_PEP_ID=MMETSP0206-20130828/50228_1 /ASSEMBLY_ACC=CAM_ASM_000279 /TAXON_ID=36767 /ORGANISM="Euplotes focardii, Strain TN1" /LENGTH=384 /DNA_ID=CAMNT_0053140381 /DNA_START=25 /DNA_END=1179 /DNA_ORIENTATION=+